MLKFGFQRKRRNCDTQTKAATIAIAEHNGPVYLRFGRPAVPIFTDKNQIFEIPAGFSENTTGFVKITRGNRNTCSGVSRSPITSF